MQHSQPDCQILENNQIDSSAINEPQNFMIWSGGYVSNGPVSDIICSDFI